MALLYGMSGCLLWFTPMVIIHFYGSTEWFHSMVLAYGILGQTIQRNHREEPFTETIESSISMVLLNGFTLWFLDEWFS